MDNDKIYKTRQGDFPAYVFEKDMYDIALPPYLEKDIVQLLEGIKNNSTLLDCMLDEVEGSINSSYWDNVISAKHAKHLRRKYLQEDVDDE